MIIPPSSQNTYVFSLTDNIERSQVKDWKLTSKASHTSDERFTGLVKLLARHAAEKDFDVMLQQKTDTLH